MDDILGVAVGQSTGDLGTAIQGFVLGQAVPRLSQQHLLHAHVSTILENQLHTTLAVQHAYATDDVWVVEGVPQET
eukprot:8977621-Pyramimonas_sp.AAC.1